MRKDIDKYVSRINNFYKMKVNSLIKKNPKLKDKQFYLEYFSEDDMKLFEVDEEIISKLDPKLQDDLHVHNIKRFANLRTNKSSDFVKGMGEVKEPSYLLKEVADLYKNHIL